MMLRICMHWLNMYDMVQDALGSPYLSCANNCLCNSSCVPRRLCNATRQQPQHHLVNSFWCDTPLFDILGPVGPVGPVGQDGSVCLYRNEDPRAIGTAVSMDNDQDYQINLASG